MVSTKFKRTYYEQFISGFNPQKPKPVYLIGGDDEFLKFKVQKLLLEKLVDPATRDFNYACYSPSEIEIGELISACDSYPFGPGRRVIRLTHANRLSPKGKKILASYLPRIPDHTTLIIIFDKISSIINLFKVASEVGVFLDLGAPFPSKIPQFVNGFFREFGLKASNGAVRDLINIVGPDLYSLHNEVQKLSLVLGKGASVTPDFISRFAGAGSGKLFEFYLDALGRRNISKAVALAGGDMLLTENPHRIILGVGYMINTLYSGISLPKSSSIEDFFRRRVGGRKFRDYIIYANGFKKSELEKIFSLLFYAEWELKLNPTPANQILQVLSYYICKPNLYDGRNPFPGLSPLN